MGLKLLQVLDKSLSYILVDYAYCFLGCDTVQSDIYQNSLEARCFHFPGSWMQNVSKYWTARRHIPVEKIHSALHKNLESPVSYAARSPHKSLSFEVIRSIKNS
jgi:hypothetical protein